MLLWTMDRIYMKVCCGISLGLIVAVIWGTIAASFVIEQNGLPMLSTLTSGIELWNEEDPWDRIRMFRERLQRSDLA